MSINAIRTRTLATVAHPPLSGFNAVTRQKAEQLSAEWKGTNAVGQNTKNFIGGQFVESKTTNWIDVVDQVRRFSHAPIIDPH